MSDLKLALSKIQATLNAPKNQRNNFGKYNYRSCEDILEGLKKVLGECVVTIDDDIKMVGARIYVKATATISLGAESLSVSAFAREEENKKGMDSAQLTGSTSSYARKYALNGLFLIDDNKDADSNERATQSNNTPAVAKPVDTIVEEINLAANINNVQYVINNWQGSITQKWASLPPETTDKLNKIMASASK